MRLEPLKIEWQCCCGPHNCVVIEEGEEPDKDDIVKLAMANKGFCHFPDVGDDDFIFVRVGKEQKALDWDALEEI